MAVAGAGISSAKSVMESLWRAVTSSFGSICLGSLVVAVVKTARQVLFAMHKSNRSTTLSAVLECCLLLLDRALTYFNKYALVYVAMYGLDFTSAGAATTELFKARAITAIVNDQLIENILALGCIVVGLSSAVVGFAYSYYLSLSHATSVVLTTTGRIHRRGPCSRGVVRNGECRQHNLRLLCRGPSSAARVSSNPQRWVGGGLGGGAWAGRLRAVGATGVA